MQEQPIVIKNIQGEVIARLGEEQGCTDDLSTAYLDELDLSNADLEGADLSNAKIDITTDIWLDAITDDETLLPAHQSPSYM